MAGGVSSGTGGSTSLQGGAATNGDFSGGASAFDSSGWNVSFGSGSITSQRQESQPLNQYALYGLLALGAVIVLRMTRGKR